MINILRNKCLSASFDDGIIYTDCITTYASAKIKIFISTPERHRSYKISSLTSIDLMPSIIGQCIYNIM